MAKQAEKTELQKMLEGLDDEYGGSPAYMRPPDGTYTAVVERFDFPHSEKTGETYLRTELRIAVGQHEGAVESTLHTLTNKERFGFTKGHLETLNIHLEKLSEIESKIGGAVDKMVEISILTRNGYRNVRVERLLGDVTFEAPKQATSNGATDDDIPF